VRSGGKFQRGVSSHVRRAMLRAAAKTQSLALGIGQAGPRPKKITAPRRMQHLLEGRFCTPTLQNDGLYSAPVNDTVAAEANGRKT
jgi:hypothetical protein